MRRKESTAKFHHLDSLLVEPQLVHLLLYVCEPEAARMPMLLPGLMIMALRTCPCCCRWMDRDSGSIAAGAHAREIAAGWVSGGGTLSKRRERGRWRERERSYAMHCERGRAETLLAERPWRLPPLAIRRRNPRRPTRQFLRKLLAGRNHLSGRQHAFPSVQHAGDNLELCIHFQARGSRWGRSVSLPQRRARAGAMI